MYFRVCSAMIWVNKLFWAARLIMECYFYLGLKVKCHIPAHFVKAAEMTERLCVQSWPSNISEYSVIVLHTACKLSGLCRCKLQTKMGPFPPPSDCKQPCQSTASHCIFSLRALFSHWFIATRRLSYGWHWICGCQKQLPFLFPPIIFQWILKFNVL